MTVGRRPSNPVFLAVVGVLWIGAGVVVAARGSGGWKYIAAVVFAVIGLVLLGSATTLLLGRGRRRNR